MDFRPLNDTERRNLITALRGNADRGLSLLMDRRDTSFAGTDREPGLTHARAANSASRR